MGKQWKQWQTLSSWAPKFTADSDCSHEINRHLLLGRKVTTNLDNVLKNQRHHFASKDPYSQSYGFSSSNVGMWELDHKEGWVKNGCFLTVVLEKDSWEFLGQQGDQTINPKGNQSCIFIGRTDAEAEATIFWPPDKNSQLWKRPWCWEIKDRRRRGWQMMKWLDGIIDSTDMNLSKLCDTVKDRDTWHAAVHGSAKSRSWLID